MPVLTLVDKTDPILREVMPEYDFKEAGLAAPGIAKDIAETMLAHRGLGLAANQAGLKVRAFAVAANPIIVAFNPLIVDTSEATDDLEEGCLTFPNVFLTINRPRSIRFRFTMPNGETDTKVYTGLTARIIQHELDHLNGILFTDHVSKLKVDMAHRKAKKIGKIIVP